MTSAKYSHCTPQHWLQADLYVQRNVKPGLRCCRLSHICPLGHIIDSHLDVTCDAGMLASSQSG
jgi:hypothetical protein